MPNMPMNSADMTKMMEANRTMPMPAEGLTKNSPPDQIQDAISKSIEMCMKEGKDQKQCAAMAYSMAREATGKEMDFGK